MSTALALYAIEDELQALTDSLETCPPELEAELQARIADYMALEQSKVDQVAHFLASLEYGRKARKDEVARLQEECKAIDHALEKLEGYVCRVIMASGNKKLCGRTNTLSVRASDAVVITDEAAIPPAYIIEKVVTTKSIDKAAIKAALKADQDIPGADLEYRSNLIRK